MLTIILGLILCAWMIVCGLQLILVPKKPRWAWIVLGICGAGYVIGAVILMWQLVTGPS